MCLSDFGFSDSKGKESLVHMKRLSDLIRGKGMLVGFLVFLMAVGIGSFAVYKSTMNKLTNENILTSIESSQVANTVSDVEKTTSADEQQADEEDDSDSEKTTITVTEGETDKAEIESEIDTEESESVNANSTVDTETQPLVMPLKGKIINPFSNGELVKSETLGYWETHDGVDIKGKVGKKVVAMTAGTVTKVIDDPLFGTEVIIDHGNNIEGHYYNLKKSVNVAEGDNVNSGEKIGEVGKTADVESKLPAHLHFGIKQNGKWIDPISFINPSVGK